MTNQTSRRSFLGISAMGLVAAVAPDLARPAAVLAGSENQMGKSGSDISVRVTSGDERLRFVQADRL